MASYDLVVLGGGPAGYVGAIRAAQLGKKVACVEVERAGGTCLNWGCIPTKALLKSAEAYELMKHADQIGFEVKGLKADFRKVMQGSREVSDKMAKGVEFLFKSKNVDYILGRGRINEDKNVVVKDDDGKESVLETRQILVATGTTPRHLPDVKVDGTTVMTSREALEPRDQPKSIVIIGAGAIGVEFAYFYNAFGTEVTMVEMMPRILPVEDQEVSEHLQRSFKKNGIEVLTDTKVESVEVGKKSVKITVSGKAEKTMEAECLLVAIGVQANLENVFSDKHQPVLEKGYLKTNNRYETSVKGIYAAGDVIGPPWLAHVASHEAIEAVEGMFVSGKKPHKIDIYPGCTYCHPQVASVGLTEQKAKERKIDYKVGKFPYRASGKAVAAGEPDGFVKILFGEKYGEVLGAHIIGAEATELIAEMGLALNLEATIDDITSTVHAHPTLSEMIGEASLAAKGEPIHI